VVVGSSNTDLIAYMDRMPRPGETLHGTDFKQGFGGKGANQCVMSAKLGAQTAMVSRVGSDVFGKETIENYQRQGVDVQFVSVSETASTGVAPIMVDSKGQNSIIIVPGANNELTPAMVDDARALIQSAKVLLVQNEIPLESSLAALRIAREAGVTSIFNIAPGIERPSTDCIVLPSIVCLNETETTLATGMEVNTLEEAKQASQHLLDTGAEGVLLTLGSQGCLYMTKDTCVQEPAMTVEAIDTSGAGDCFIGTLACSMAQEPAADMATHLKRATRVAALSVQAHGTQTSYPRRADLPSNTW